VLVHVCFRLADRFHNYFYFGWFIIIYGQDCKRFTYNIVTRRRGKGLGGEINKQVRRGRVVTKASWRMSVRCYNLAATVISRRSARLCVTAAL